MDGLWTIEFGSSTGEFGSGVIILRRGKIQGGDDSYFYIGSYEESTVSGANTFRARINVKPFLPRARSVFNTFDQELILNLEGTLKDENNAVAVGRSDEIPGVDLGVRLTRRAEAA